MLKYLVLLVCGSLHTFSLQASEFTWTGTTSAQLDLGANWSPGLPTQPPSVGDVAHFTDSTSQLSPFLNDGSTFAFYLASFNNSTNSYELSISNNSTLTFGVTGDAGGLPCGIELLNTSSVSTAVVSGATLNFLGHANASLSSDTSSGASFRIGSTTPGTLNFEDNSVAGSAIISVGDLTGMSVVNFYGNNAITFSSAQESTIAVGFVDVAGPGTVNFHGFSTSDTAQIIVGNISGINNNSGTLNYLNGSTAGSSRLVVADHLGASSINFYGDSDTVFSHAGTAVIIVGGSPAYTEKDVDGTLTFHGFSSAENAGIFVGDPNGRSQVTFRDSSTADHARIQVGGQLLSLSGSTQGKVVFQDSSTAAFAQFEVVDGSILEFDSGSSGGHCSVALTNSGALNFPDPGSFSIDSLTGDSGSSVYLSSATLTIDYDGSEAIEMTGQIFDLGMGGSLIKSGTGTFVLSGTDSYTGLTTIQEGILRINGSLTGSVLLSNGTLGGVGSIGGSVTTVNGVVSPGNSVGTLHIAGNYTQGSGTTYLVQVDHISSSLLDIGGIATLNNNPVEVVATEDNIYPNHPYLILQSGGGIVGAFGQPVINFSGTDLNVALLQAEIVYDPSHFAFLILQTHIVSAAETINQNHVAEQLDSITNATLCEGELLSAILREDPSNVGHVLDELSGEPYANLFYIAQINSYHCIQNLFKPLRSLIASVEEPCGGNDDTFWLEVNGGRSFLDGNRNSGGLHMSSFELSLGSQAHLTNAWTLGGALFYEHDSIDFSINAHGTNHTLLAAIYGLFRPSFGYFLVDLIGGYSTNLIKRKIEMRNFLAKAKGRSNMGQMTFYGEGGFDLKMNCFLLQPFVGIEASRYNRGAIHEHGADCANLSVSEKGYDTASSRLGAHFTCSFNEGATVVGADGAWQYRFNSGYNHITEHFKDFGSCFFIEGVAWDRSSVEGSLFVNTQLYDCWSVFARLSGQKWGNALTYDFLTGVESSW